MLQVLKLSFIMECFQCLLYLMTVLFFYILGDPFTIGASYSSIIDKKSFGEAIRHIKFANCTCRRSTTWEGNTRFIEENHRSQICSSRLLVILNVYIL